jgi:plasmid maintenance system antidote protein VapI
MKTDKLNSKYTPEEQADSFVFRTKLTPKQVQDAADQLNLARKKIKEQRTDSQTLYARVKQLQFQMEDYAKSEKYKEELSFAYFLRKYIRLRYKVQKNFAEDIKIAPTELSSILNNGRPPGKKMIVRLELHSSSVISAVSWYRLWEKEKEYELKTDKKIRMQEEKYVHNRMVFDF